MRNKITKIDICSEISVLPPLFFPGKIFNKKQSIFGVRVYLPQIQNNPSCSRKSQIPICCLSRLQLITDGPSRHLVLGVAFVLAHNMVQHCLFRRNGDRDRPGLGELVHVRGGGANVNATLVCQPPREACNLGIVLLPFGDLTGAR